MRYSIDIKTPPAPVDLIESSEGLTVITSFTTITAFTLRALLQGYGCSNDMLNRVENASSFMHCSVSPIEFCITSNPHTFAACVTNTSKSILLGQNNEILIQLEILDLIPSLLGSFEAPGNYSCIRRVSNVNNLSKSPTCNYTPPVFDTALRYLTLVTLKENFSGIKRNRHMMILYIPH